MIPELEADLFFHYLYFPPLSHIFVNLIIYASENHAFQVEFYLGSLEMFLALSLFVSRDLCYLF
jgi:hypothetical protein